MISQQAITWANFHLDLHRYVASLGPNELIQNFHINIDTMLKVATSNVTDWYY